MKISGPLFSAITIIAEMTKKKGGKNARVSIGKKRTQSLSQTTRQDDPQEEEGNSITDEIEVPIVIEETEGEEEDMMMRMFKNTFNDEDYEGYIKINTLGKSDVECVVTFREAILYLLEKGDVNLLWNPFYKVYDQLCNKSSFPMSSDKIASLNERMAMCIDKLYEEHPDANLSDCPNVDWIINNPDFTFENK